jgi:hypothetical protein
MAKPIGGLISWQVLDTVTKKLISKQSVLLDITDEETVNKVAEATKYPVERGAKPADHHRVENTKIQLKARILSFPVSTAGGGVTSSADMTAAQEADGTRAAALYNALDSARLNSYLVTFTNPTRQFDNCLITNLNYTQDAKTGQGAMSLSIGLEQQRFVDLKSVNTKRAVISKNPVCEEQKDKGQQTPAANSDAGASILYQTKHPETAVIDGPTSGLLHAIKNGF